MSAPLDIERMNAGFRVGDWLVEPMRNRISRGDASVQLEPRLVEVLLCLARRAGETVTREEFLERVWTGMVVTDDALARSISELRKALGDDARSPTYIETIRKTGYRLIAPVSLPEPPAASAAPPPPSDETPGVALPSSSLSLRPTAWPDHPLFRTWLGRSLLGVLFLSLGLLVWFGLRTATPAPGPAEPVPLTSYPGLETDPALSPDGEHVAFAWDEQGSGDFDVFIKQRGVEPPMRLTNRDDPERLPAWSPDKLHLAFVRSGPEGHAVYVTPTIGGSERLVADFGPRPVLGIAWSPGDDSLAVAVRRSPSGASALYFLPTGGGAVRRVTTPPETASGDLYPAFSPDGRRLAFVRAYNDHAHAVLVTDVSGGTPELWSEPGSPVLGLSWTPDGKGLLVASSLGGTPGLWRLSAPGASPEPVVAAAEGTLLGGLSLSPETGRVAYAQRAGDTNIWRLQRNGSSLRAERWTGSTRADTAPAVSADGARVAFVSDRSGQSEVWLADADGNEAHRLTDLGATRVDAPAWSPDGRRVAFVVTLGGQSDIYVADADGNGALPLTDSPADDTAPAWSRDSVSVYFASARTGRWEIWKKKPGDAEAVQVTRNGGRAARETPDGRSLLVVRPDTAGIWRVALSDSLPTASSGIRLVDHLAAEDLSNWQVAEDGVYFVRRGRKSPVLVRYGFDTLLTSVVALLPALPPEPGLALAPDGSWFLYVREENRASDILLLDTDG